MGPLVPVINSVLEELGRGVKEKHSLLQTAWPKILGPSFSAHSQPDLRENGTLCVWVDDSTLAYELSQRYRGTVLKRVGAALGEDQVKRIVFRVGNPR